MLKIEQLITSEVGGWMILYNSLLEKHESEYQITFKQDFNSKINSAIVEMDELIKTWKAGIL